METEFPFTVSIPKCLQEAEVKRGVVPGFSIVWKEPVPCALHAPLSICLRGKLEQDLQLGTEAKHSVMAPGQNGSPKRFFLR